MRLCLLRRRGRAREVRAGLLTQLLPRCPSEASGTVGGRGLPLCMPSSGPSWLGCDTGPVPWWGGSAAVSTIGMPRPQPAPLPWRWGTGDRSGAGPPHPDPDTVAAQPAPAPGPPAPTSPQDLQLDVLHLVQHAPDVLLEVLGAREGKVGVLFARPVPARSSSGVKPLGTYQEPSGLVVQGHVYFSHAVPHLVGGARLGHALRTEQDPSWTPLSTGGAPARRPHPPLQVAPR